MEAYFITLILRKMMGKIMTITGELMLWAQSVGCIDVLLKIRIENKSGNLEEQMALEWLDHPHTIYFDCAAKMTNVRNFETHFVFVNL